MVAVYLPKGIYTKIETERWKVWRMRNRPPDQEITIKTSNDSGNAHWQRTATENPDNRSNVYTVDFTDGDNNWDDKGHDHSSCRPLAPAELDAPFSILFYEFGIIFVQSASAVKNRFSILLHKDFLALNPSTCRSIPK